MLAENQDRLYRVQTITEGVQQQPRHCQQVTSLHVAHVVLLERKERRGAVPVTRPMQARAASMKSSWRSLKLLQWHCSDEPFPRPRTVVTAAASTTAAIATMTVEAQERHERNEKVSREE